MQLDNNSFAAALSIAACSLLSGNAQAQTPEVTEPGWQFESAVMYYGETDRVQALEGIFSAKKSFEDQKLLNLKLTVDTLTGASANGAIAQSEVQTFTRPSGNGYYQISSGETPLDDTFRDTRVQFNGQWTQPLSRLYTVSGGIHLSNEYDYLSLGVNASIARDFNNRNTTLSTGFSLSNDTITPEGGIPLALADMPNYSQGKFEQDGWGSEATNAQYLATRSRDSDDKTTIDFLFGITQVINKNLITQLNYSYSQVDGYMTDPFKVTSIVDSEGITRRNIYESRPDSRQKNSVFAQAKYSLGESVVDISYRYLWDDWQVKSNTIDFRYWLPFDYGGYIEPHVRYYEQEAADFYKPLQLESDQIPEFVSSDYRIGDMTATTLGVKYGHPNNDGTEWAVRAEWYHQTSNDVGVALPGLLTADDVYSDVDAVILQFSYKF
ncbi:MAG: DUF3570 domain-containing protein [Gammaproteobacteria bacterium]|nr:DUF3570 domain-containing protein [Gammaproteobacteria bacterium]